MGGDHSLITFIHKSRSDRRASCVKGREDPSFFADCRLKKKKDTSIIKKI